MCTAGIKQAIKEILKDMNDPNKKPPKLWTSQYMNKPKETELRHRFAEKG